MSRPPFSRGPFDLIGTDKQISGNLPRLADLLNRFDRKGAPARKNLRCARTRAQELGQFRLRVAEFFDGVVEHVDWIEAVVDIDRPTLRFVGFDKRKEHVELVALFGALSGAPAGIDFRERRPVILVGANGRISIR